MRREKVVILRGSTAAASPPAAPSALTATAIYTASKRVNLSWTDNSSDETAFAVFKSTDDVSYTEIATTAAGATTYSVTTGLTEDVLTYFKVKARNSGGDSAATTAASATPRILPTDVTGCVQWLKSDAGVTESSNRVSAWADQSGAGNNVIQNTAGFKPLYAATDSDFTGSPPSIQFVASRNDVLQKTSLSLGAFHIFTVLKPTATLGMPWTFTSNNTDYINNGTGASSYCGDAASTAGVRSAKDVNAGNGWMGTAVTTISRQRDGTNTGHAIWKNGAAVAMTNTGYGSGDPLTVAQSRTLNIGGQTSFFMDMKVVEFIIFDNAISAGDRAKVENYLKARYAHY